MLDTIRKSSYVLSIVFHGLAIIAVLNGDGYYATRFLVFGSAFLVAASGKGK